MTHKTLIQLAAVISISLLAAATTWWIMGPPERRLACDPANLKPDEICFDSIPSGQQVLWVDARSRSDWQRDGLAGSILWNLDPEEDIHTFEADAVMKVAMNPYVVVYCDDEQCGTSRQIAQRIRNLDLGAEVHVLHGGWQALKQAGVTADPNRNP